MSVLESLSGNIADFIVSILDGIFLFIDGIVYQLLGYVYNLFNNAFVELGAKLVKLRVRPILPDDICLFF